jgi:hypothetical protein
MSDFLKVQHLIGCAKSCKHYVIRAKRDGYPETAAQYQAERVEFMAEARRLRAQVAA